MRSQPVKRTTPVAGRELNNEVLRLHGDLQTARGSNVTPARVQLSRAIAKRAAALNGLIEQNAKEALQLALSAQVLDEIATQLPDSAPLLEQHGVWRGSMDAMVYDYPGGSSRKIYRLHAGNNEYDVHLAGPEPAGYKSGAIVSIAGVRQGSRIAAETGTVEAGATTPVLGCSTTGVQNTAVLLVNFPGYPAPSYLDVQNVSQAFFGTTGRSLSGYWQEASYGQASASGAVYGPYTLSSNYGYPSSCAASNTLLNEAITLAAGSGADFQSYTRVFVVAPDFGCGWAGAATMACGTLTSPAGSFTASTSWINGTTWQNGTDNATETIAHEGGHNLGLNHSNSRAFGTDAVGPLGTQGTDTEYGDSFTAMTDGALGHYDAPHKVEILGWLGSSNYQVVQSSGTWTIAPLETPSTGLQALKIQRGTGNDAWLWVEYRQPVGNYDNSYATGNVWSNQVFSGAVIHYEDSYTTGGHSDLLDFTPASPWAFWDPALAAGQTWADPYSNVSISVLSANSSGLTVSVSYGGAGAACTHVNPTLSASPFDPSTTPGSGVNYTVAVTNNDSAACSSSTFGMSSSQPSGWATTFSPASLSLSPGQTSSITMSKTAPGGTGTSTYAVNAIATNSAFTGTATASVTVTAPPVLSVSLSAAGSYTKGQTAPFTATVLSGGTPVAGASAKFTLTKSKGSNVTQTVTTGSDGTATWSYKLSQTGTYSVVANVTGNSQSAASNTATFTVH